MAQIRLSEFKASVQDVARPNRFWVQITGTGGGLWTEAYGFLAKSAGLPSRTIGDIELNWQGMKAKIAGDPTFDDFTMTFVNDYDFNIKAFFEEWLEVIATMESNVRTTHEEYKAEIIITQLGRDAETILKEYKLIGAYPKQMDQVELSMESTDTAEELSITFAYDYFEVTV
jgi:hypothetical protein